MRLDLIENWQILKPTDTTPKFAPGFRLSWRDVIIIIAGIGLSLGLNKSYWPISLIIMFALGHFFLFCNVFRISRRLEFIWAGAFIILCSATIICEFPNWMATIVISLGITVVVVACEIRKPSYHGICWQKVNPGLKEWWDSNTSPQGYN